MSVESLDVTVVDGTPQPSEERIHVLEVALAGAAAVANAEKSDSEIRENFLGAKRLGPYWNTPPFRSVIRFEEFLTRACRTLVDTKAMEFGELAELLERYRRRADIEGPCRDSARSPIIMRLRQCLSTARRNFGWGTVDSWTDEVLARIRERVRSGRRLWQDPLYWKNTEWIEAPSEEVREVS